MALTTDISIISDSAKLKPRPVLQSKIAGLKFHTLLMLQDGLENLPMRRLKNIQIAIVLNSWVNGLSLLTILGKKACY